MFIKQKPRSGERNIFAAALIALMLAGCANPGTTPSWQNEAATTPALPSESQTTSASLLDADDDSAAVVTNEKQADSDEVATASAPDPAAASLSLDVEFEAEQAALAHAKQQQEEAAVVAAIKASLAETRNKHNAWYRLRNGMQMAAVDNPRVRAQLKWFLEHPGYMQRVMERARPILPFVLDELEQRGLPTELALLPIVESAYQAFAYSHGRASGMWQIIPSTGRFLGLKQNWWYDGRRDIIESTRAAIAYLDSLAQQFDGDWELALAAYTAGPG